MSGGREASGGATFEVVVWAGGPKSIGYSVDGMGGVGGKGLMGKAVEEAEREL